MKSQIVVHLTSVHARYDNRILLKQCVSSVNHGYVTFLVVADGKGDEIFNGVNIIDVGNSKGILDRMLRVTKSVYRKALELDGDIYQIHDPELIPKALALKEKGKEVVYDVHEDYITSIKQKTYIPAFLKNFIVRVLDWYEKKSAKKLTVLIAEKYYKERFPNATAILNYPILPANPVKIDYYESPLSKRVIYSGNVTEVRGAFSQSILLNKIPDLNMTFIGYCSPELSKKIREGIRGSLDRFTMIGEGTFVPFKQIAAKYQTEKWLAGLALFPKTKHYEKKELTKFFEYMAYGLPIVCSDFPFWKEFVSIHQCGIAVDPNNEDEVSAALEWLANNPRKHHEMATNGQRAVYKYFNWVNEERKLIKTYQALLHGK